MKKIETLFSMFREEGGQIFFFFSNHVCADSCMYLSHLIFLLVTQVCISNKDKQENGTTHAILLVQQRTRFLFPVSYIFRKKKDDAIKIPQFDFL